MTEQIKGYVTLDINYAKQQAIAVLRQIQVKRDTAKSELIQAYIHDYFKLSWWQKIFKITKQPITSEEAWQRLREKDAKDFCFNDPSWQVSRMYHQVADDMREIINACNIISSDRKIMVTTYVATWLATGDHF